MTTQKLSSSATEYWFSKKILGGLEKHFGLYFAVPIKCFHSIQNKSLKIVLTSFHKH